LGFDCAKLFNVGEQLQVMMISRECFVEVYGTSLVKDFKD